MFTRTVLLICSVWLNWKHCRPKIVTNLLTCIFRCTNWLMQLEFITSEWKCELFRIIKLELEIQNLTKLFISTAKKHSNYHNWKRKFFKKTNMQCEKGFLKQKFKSVHFLQIQIFAPLLCACAINVTRMLHASICFLSGVFISLIQKKSLRQHESHNKLFPIHSYTYGKINWNFKSLKVTIQ